jgi:hypothetical protein
VGRLTASNQRATRRRALAAVALALLAPGATRRHRSAQAAPSPSAEEVKAAFLYNFGKFVVWPPDALPPEAGFVIGVIGDDSIVEALHRTVQSRSLHDRKIVVKRLRFPREARACHILFVGAGERDHLAGVLAPLEGASVLTVSDMDGFVDRGGMINLVLERSRYRFEVNLRVAERARLTVSSQLLKLARRVIAAPRAGG